MEIERNFIDAGDCRIPAILIRPDRPRGAAVVLHGYGGNKEEQLGLAFVAAGSGLATYAIDLRGHGEHPLPLDAGIADDVATVIRSCRNFGKVTTIGHSLGGRLALISDADYRIGISPSLSRTYGERTQEMLRAMRSYRVRPADLATLIDVQAALPVWDPMKAAGTAAILYAERDAPEIVADCRAAAGSGARAECIAGTLHSDIFNHERAFTAIGERIRWWYGE